MTPQKTNEKEAGWNPGSPHHARIQAVFEGRKPDRVPICEQAFASSVASLILGREAFTGSTDVHYAEACAWLDGENAHEDFVEKLYQDTVALHKALDLDILFLPWRFDTRPTKRVGEYRILYGDPAGDEWAVCEFDPQSRTYGCAEEAHPAPTFEEVCAHIRKALAGPKPGDVPVSVDPFRLRAVREHGRDFVVAGASGMGIPMKPGWLEATLLDPGLVGEWLDLSVAGNLFFMDAQSRAGIRILNGGGDFAFNGGPLYSPAFFHDIMAPRWKRLFDGCRERGMYYIFRSDGNLWPVADDLFGWAHPHACYECDYDAGMRFAELRAKFPGLVLMGNVSCDALLSGSPAAIRRRVEECIRAAAPRVIVASSNAILHGTPPENVLAMYAAAKEYRL